MKYASFILILIQIVHFGCGTQGSGQPSGTAIQPHISTTVLAENLEVPWGMDILPDGEVVFTERNGKISIINTISGKTTLLTTRKINNQAEGGLLGIAVDPDFESNGYLYIYETIETGNRIVRLSTDSLQITGETVLVRGIPKAKYHDGGILRFGPDGYLYAGTGDARQPDLAQDTSSLAGKILRMDRDGEPARDNPFANLVYSYGHRNVQGLAWDESGQLFATEHGPSGELNNWCCHDELNKIEAGNNYGWPLVIGNNNCANCTAPVAQSGDDTWAPGGLAFVDTSGPLLLHNKMVMACLRGRKLIIWNHKDGTQETVLLDGDFKRLRNLILLPNGSLLIATSNKDGREPLPNRNDDRLILLK